MTLAVRAMRPEDVPACVRIVNHIIEMGGTTAYEEPFSIESLRSEYFEDPPITNVVLANGRVVGFQACFDAGEGLYSIGSFTDQKNPVKGAGRALFEKTLADCKARGGEAILAKITADNAPGLAYYSRMGFGDWQVWKGDTIRNGRPVDRIVKRFPLK